MIIDQRNLENVLFLDIETVAQYPAYSDLPDRWKLLWNKKAAQIAANNETAAELYNRASIYAEFGKIICISAGFLNREGNSYGLRVKSFYGDDEKLILEEFAALLNSNFNTERHLLCAHNGKEFDFPYLCRRMLVLGIELPGILDISGRKPWEVRHLDTLQLWKFGDFKSYTSLELLAALFDIATPKDDIDGSMIYEVYYKDKDLERIRTYCQKDVFTLCNVFLRMNNMPVIDEEHLTIVP